MKNDYECVLVHDDPHPHYSVVLRSKGDEVILHCPPHEFGRFVLGGRYSIEIKKIEENRCHS